MKNISLFDSGVSAKFLFFQDNSIPEGYHRVEQPSSDVENTEEERKTLVHRLNAYEPSLKQNTKITPATLPSLVAPLQQEIQTIKQSLEHNGFGVGANGGYLEEIARIDREVRNGKTPSVNADKLGDDTGPMVTMFLSKYIETAKLQYDIEKFAHANPVLEASRVEQDQLRETTSTRMQEKKSLRRVANAVEVKIDDGFVKIDRKNCRYGLGAIVRKMLREKGDGKKFGYGLPVEFRGSKKFQNLMKRKNKAKEIDGVFSSKLADTGYIDGNMGWVVKMENGNVVVAENEEYLQPESQEVEVSETQGNNEIPKGEVERLNQKFKNQDIEFMIFPNSPKEIVIIDNNIHTPPQPYHTSISPYPTRLGMLVYKNGKPNKFKRGDTDRGQTSSDGKMLATSWVQISDAGYSDYQPRHHRKVILNITNDDIQVQTNDRMVTW